MSAALSKPIVNDTIAAMFKMLQFAGKLKSGNLYTDAPRYTASMLPTGSNRLVSLTQDIMYPAFNVMVYYASGEADHDSVFITESIAELPDVLAKAFAIARGQAVTRNRRRSSRRPRRTSRR